MARAAVLGRLNWLVAKLSAVRDETAVTRTLVLDVPGWPGHLAGQHVDVRLTAPDGYSTQRSYSIASAAGGERLELTVEQLPDGEVSPYLVEVLSIGDPLELRGPIGGWFVWDDARPEPVLLVAGGSGVVPLMAMIRARATVATPPPFRLIYSVRDPGALIYHAELDERVAMGDGLEVTYIYTRVAPAGSTRPPGRIDATTFAEFGWPASSRPSIFVCGPTGFVEAASDLLVAAGHPAATVKTERFGPSGN
jgi:ferredoxin-NADP reductase